MTEDILLCCICCMLFAIGCAGGMFIWDAIVLGTFIWFWRGDCGLGRGRFPSVLTCCMRGDVCGSEPGIDESGIEYAGYPEAAAVAIAAACEGETPYGGCMP